MKKGILFDLDGTLWDSSENVVKSWNEVLARYDLRRITRADMQSYMGKTLEKIGELMLPELDASERSCIMKECCDNENNFLGRHGGTLFPDLENVLAELSQKYELFIVSNCQSGYIETFLQYHKLERYFTDYECPGGTGREKGENIRIVIGRNNLEKAAYIGDTQGDYESAVFAGIPFIHAAYGFGNVEADVPKIKSIGEIANAVKEYLE